MSADVVLDEGRAPLIKVFETAHYRLVQQDWDEDGAWYQLFRTGAQSWEGDVYRLDEALDILLDFEADEVMASVSRPDDPDGPIPF